ncbi:MAG TPA: carboxyl transferase domain-containing protein [Noviherbaspirillum sp.]|nr:carboxyl transferase domain-containing protein [Noviherbaspirillum sp.]
MEQKIYSRAELSQRLAALFKGDALRYLATNSDLCLVEGHIANRKVLVIATEPAAALGTFGVAECVDFKWALLRARATGAPVLLLIDSAGTRLTAGLPVQGAIRALMREVLDARLAEVPMLAVIGRYAFGSASMLSFSADARLYSENTQLAMSGPRVLQAALTDDASRDTVSSRINGISRAAVGNAEQLIADDLDAYAEAVRAWVAKPITPCVTREALLLERRHLSQRLSAGAQDARRALGNGEGPVLDGDTLRCVMDRSFGAADAIMLAELAESACSNGAMKTLTIVMDCPGHSTSLQDEEIILSQYLVHLALSLRHLVREGVSIRLRVTGTLSGGIYIGLAAAASSTELAPGATIRTLPVSSLVNILGSEMQETANRASYVEWGLVDSALPPGHVVDMDSGLVCIPGQGRELQVSSFVSKRSW